MLGIFNVKKNLRDRFSKKFDIHNFNDGGEEFPKLDCLFIDWRKEPTDVFALQAALMDYYAKKKIPIVIFDRFMTITQKEFEWSKKFNVHFFEPAVKNRTGFEFLPQWVETPNLPIEEYESEFDFVFNGRLKNCIKSFEKYYVELAKMNPDLKIYYTDSTIPKEKIKEYKFAGLYHLDFFEDKHWSKTSFTIIIDSMKNYTIGYINPAIFESMKHGCLPILPIEHRFFGSMFEKRIVSNFSDIEYFMCLKNIRNRVILDTYKNIEKYYPEFTIEYFDDTICQYLEKV